MALIMGKKRRRLEDLMEETSKSDQECLELVNELNEDALKAIDLRWAAASTQDSQNRVIDILLPFCDEDPEKTS